MIVRARVGVCVRVRACVRARARKMAMVVVAERGIKKERKKERSECRKAAEHKPFTEKTERNAATWDRSTQCISADTKPTLI